MWHRCYPCRLCKLHVIQCELVCIVVEYLVQQSLGIVKLEELVIEVIHVLYPMEAHGELAVYAVHVSAEGQYILSAQFQYVLGVSYYMLGLEHRIVRHKCMEGYHAHKALFLYEGVDLIVCKVTVVVVYLSLVLMGSYDWFIHHLTYVVETRFGHMSHVYDHTFRKVMVN